MTLFDWIILLFLAFALYKGLKNGFIKEVLSLVGIIVAVSVAILATDPGAEWLAAKIEASIEIARLVTIVGVFILVLILFNLIGKLLTKLIETLLLGPVNRLFGAIFSTLKATVVLSLILFFLLRLDLPFDVPSRDTRENSMLYPYIEPFAPATLTLLGKISPGISESLDELTGKSWRDPSWKDQLPSPSLPELPALPELPDRNVVK